MAIINGTGGDDTLNGGGGNDTLDGGDGNDTLYGGEGNDSLVGSAGNDKIYGGEGTDTLSGGDGDDYLSKYADTGAGLFFGGAGADSILGGLGNDSIDGGEGDDGWLEGYEGNDSIQGGQGDDTLRGDEGNDTLNGGAGNDSLYGGDGNDIYYVNSASDYVEDSGGVDTAYVSANFVKLPSSIDHVIYVDGAQALPYWIDALLPDDAAGLYFKALLGESKTFSYIFPASLPSYDRDADDAKGFTAFTATQMARTKVALAYVSSVVDLQFISTNNVAALNTLTFASNDQTNSGGYAKFPSTNYDGNDIFLDINSNNTSLADHTYGALTLIHEIGHSLGLKHPFDHQQAGEGGVAEPPYLTGTEDSTTWTVMSYESSTAQYYLQYSPLDIATLQYLYGPSKTARTGNDAYTVSASSANFIWDGAGVDVVDASAATQAATLYLSPGYWGFLGAAKAAKITSNGQFTVNFGSVIENLIGSAFDDQLYGNEIGNVIEGGAGNDTIEGWDGADSLVGGLGNDLLTGGAGSDTINGGAGLDTTVYTSRFAAYAVSALAAANSYTVVSDEGDDSLLNMERLQFSDAFLALDLDGNAGQTYRLYQASFNRTPDFAGLGGWIAAMDAGTTPVQVATSFMASDEFKSLYGASTTDAQFVALLYANALHRAAGAADVGYWVDQLKGAQTRAQVLIAFSESAENKASVLPNIATGIVYTNTAQNAGDAKGLSLSGTSANDTLVGSVGSDTVLGAAGNDSLLGGAGKDSLTGGAGNDTIDGGAGLDTAVFSGTRASHAITATTNASANVKDLSVSSTASGVDTLSLVERLKFDDVTLAFDTSGNAGQTYRLYQAAFNRTPDKAGLSDWVKGVDGGLTLLSVAGSFIQSAEFKSLYGASPTDAQFVNLLYTNALHRTADASGLAYWVDQLTSSAQTRAQVLCGFAESAENQASLIGFIQNGIELAG